LPNFYFDAILIRSTNGMGVLNMNRFASASVISSILVTIFLFFLPLGAYAQAGCCSKHGGVAGCNKSTNYLSCKDGTTSPSCTCEGTKTKPTKATKAAPAAAAAPTETTTNTKAEKAAKAKEAKATKAGCCSGHGGVDKCNKSTGFQVCKDGTQSTTCACGKKK
jgi:hypothetical protein